MKKYIAILFACVSFCACEDFLTQENPNKIESEYYFKDESSLEIYANGLTRSFATGIKNFVNGDKNADTHAWDGAAAYFKDNYSASDASNWGTSNWSQLRSINFYLDNMRKADAPEAVLNHYEGVGRFFRALFYYAKVRTFGAGALVREIDRGDRPGGALQGSRQPRIRLPQDSRRSRLRLHLLLDGGFLPQPGVVHSSLRGPRAQSAFLPLRGDDAQIPHARSLDGPAVAVGRECDVPRRVRQGVRGDHRRRRLPFDRQCRRPPHAVPCDVHREQRHDGLRQRDHLGAQLRFGAERDPLHELLFHQSTVCQLRLHAAVHQHLSDDRRYAVHRQISRLRQRRFHDRV